MNVTVKIHYITIDNKVSQSGSFPLKGKKPEEVALEFWKWIKKEHPFECELVKVIINEEDKTDLVKSLERKSYEDYDLGLPF